MTHDPGRRDFVILIGSVAAGSLLGCGNDTAAPTPTSAASPSPLPAASPQVGTSSCVVRPALTEGPYFVDERLNRSDIRSDPGDGSYGRACRCC